MPWAETAQAWASIVQAGAGVAAAVLLGVGIHRMEREGQRRAEEHANRHAETMTAEANRHAESMTALRTLIERTAPPSPSSTP